MVVVRWCDWNREGLEHCVCDDTPGGFTLEGVVAGTRGGLYGGHYMVRADTAYATREVRVAYINGPSLHLEADGSGYWFDLIGKRDVDDLDGCLDVDIGLTPATNALPIRRLDLKEGDSRDITAAYVPLPGQIEGPFLPSRAAQRYTCLVQGRRYKYEGLFRAFEAELEIDEAGLVLDYPETFRRVANTTV